MEKQTHHYQIYKLEDMNIHGDLGPNFDPMAPSRPSFTIHVAPRGSVIYNDLGEPTDKTSKFGHIYLSIQGINPVTGQYESMSLGFSPGDDWGSAKDNISFNDHVRYKGASTLTVTSNSRQFHHDFNNLFTVMHKYKTEESSASDYNPFSNNCGQSIQDVLEQANISGINIPFWPDDAYDKLQYLADFYITPLVIDLNGNGIQTLADSFGVSFDFEGKGTLFQTGWVHPDDGLLVWDKNKDGIINNGEELFGDNSLLNNHTKAKEGFSALAEFDSNGDGIIDKTDSLWSELKVWQDKNSDGLSQSHELMPLDTLSIKSIELDSKETNFFDDNGNFHKLMAKVNWENGTQTDITDVLFHQKTPSTQTPSVQQTVNKMIDDIASFTQSSNGDISLAARISTEYQHNVSLVANSLG